VSGKAFIHKPYLNISTISQSFHAVNDPFDDTIEDALNLRSSQGHPTFEDASCSVIVAATSKLKEVRFLSSIKYSLCLANPISACIHCAPLTYVFLK
jgi:hypothetical protein